MEIKTIKWIFNAASSFNNFEIQKYYQNGVYSRDNLSIEIKDRVYIINLDEYYDTGTHWVALYVLNNDVTFFDSFVVEHTPNEI